LEGEEGLENEHLRTAITRAGLTLEEFADIVQVDVKTVQRWLAGRTAPYPRNRATVAGALDTTEDALWPNAVPAPTATGASELATHATGDAIAAYGHATDPAVPEVDELLRAAVERIEIVIPDLRSGTGLIQPFRTSAANGCRVRLIIEDPDERVEPLIGVDAIEVRASCAGEDHVFFRADDEMLVVLIRIGSAGVSPPVIHLRRQADDGLFDRLVEDFENRWLEATPLASREQLYPYLADTELEPGSEPEHSPEADPLLAPATARPPEAPIAPPADAPRRWPRRPT
jgi:transcriptional regulator with XRE-family HTH domain